jgi:hypothetical protein
MAAVGDFRVEALRAPADAELGERLVSFWTGHGALDRTSAHQRLARVVCVAFGPGDEIAGVNSVAEGMAPLVNRSFWIYRRFLPGDLPAELDQEMLEAAYNELARRFADSGAVDGPVGLCVLVSDRAMIERDRDAVWPTGFVFAGYTEDDAQVRIRYFDLAPIA